MKHKIRYILSFLMLASNLYVLIAQNRTIDSVKTLIQNTTNTNDKIINLNLLSSLLGYQKPMEAILYAREAFHLSEKINYPKGQIIAYRQMAIAYMNINQYDTAKVLLKTAIDVCKKSDNKKLESSCLNTLGNINFDLSKNKEALSYYLAALKISEEVRDTHNIPMRLVNVGRAQMSDLNYIQAKNYFFRAIKASEGVHNSNALSFAMYNLGRSYYETNRIDSAKIYYEKALELENASIHSQNKREILASLAEIYEKYKNYVLADAYLNESLAVSKSSEDHKMEITCLAKLSKLKQNQNDWQAAIRYAELCLFKADSIHVLSSMNEAYFALAQSYAGAKNFEKAYNYQLRYKETSDSILILKKSAQMQEMQTLYEVAKKETENELLRNAQAEKDKRIHIQWAIIAFISIIIVFVGFLSASLYRSRKREAVVNQELQEKNALLEEINIVKDKLFSIIGHDLRAPINSLKSLLDLLTSNIVSEEQARMLFGKLIKEVNYTSDLLENLLQWAKSQLQGMKVNPQKIDIQEIIYKTMELLQGIADKKEIKIHNEIDTSIWAMADEEMIKTVIRNLLANALKFTPAKGVVHINSQITDNQVEITVKDNGVGMPPETLSKLFEGNITTRGTDNEKGTGLGLLMIKDFLDKNKGSIRVQSEVGKGSTFIVTLPQ